ncbi:MAG: hypothetical protein KGZ25_14740, partial [Planctomycetes bacterium]|nr:hypothetical protein [Planctomycetota bacterium]
PKRLPPHLAWVGPYLSREHKASLHRHKTGGGVGVGGPLVVQRYTSTGMNPVVGNDGTARDQRSEVSDDNGEEVVKL